MTMQNLRFMRPARLLLSVAMAAILALALTAGSAYATSTESLPSWAKTTYQQNTYTSWDTTASTMDTADTTSTTFVSGSDTGSARALHGDTHVTFQNTKTLAVVPTGIELGGAGQLAVLLA